ncbi:MAG: hypothetical protein LWY06_18900 [Firmicutes bacterium]|nr:hypothetical protein [Bacillota bacterium]
MDRRYIPVSLENPANTVIKQNGDFLEILFKPDRDNAQNMQTIALASFFIIWVCVIAYLQSFDPKAAQMAAARMPVGTFLVLFIAVVYLLFVMNHMLIYFFGGKRILINNEILQITVQKGILTGNRLFEKQETGNLAVTVNNSDQSLDLMGCIGVMFCKFIRIDYDEKRYALTFISKNETVTVAISDNEAELESLKNMIMKTGFFDNESDASSKNSLSPENDIIKAPDNL